MEAAHVGTTPESPSVAPWYRQVNRDQWRAFWATFLGWVLDGFDFTILTFVLIDIQRSSPSTASSPGSSAR